MQQTVQVAVHESESPEANTALLCEGLRTKTLPQKFLYNNYGQTSRWLALHRAWSPAHKDAETIDIYTVAARETATKPTTPVVHVVGLGCGSGEKEGRVVEALRAAGRIPIFSPLDTSLGMVLTATKNVSAQARGVQCNPILADLPKCSTLPALLRQVEPAGAERILCLFGILHTFEPDQLLPRLLNSIRSQDSLLLSVNMAHENGYSAAMQRILQQYDNAETHHWLEGALLQLGFERGDGAIEVTIEMMSDELSRFAADYRLRREVNLQIGEEVFHFKPGEVLRVFYSYRYTASTIQRLLAASDLHIHASWASSSMEEGILLCGRAPRKKQS